MKFRMSKKLVLLSIYQLIILVLSLIFYHKISLLSYINISFFISGGLLLTSLLVYTIHTGFFDGIFKSFNYTFSRGHEKRSFADVPALSELISINKWPLVFYGLMNGILMLIALLFYYS